jgi:hypothetical protein
VIRAATASAVASTEVWDAAVEAWKR